MDALETLRQWVQESHRIVFFGEAVPELWIPADGGNG